MKLQGHLLEQSFPTFEPCHALHLSSMVTCLQSLLVLLQEVRTKLLGCGLSSFGDPCSSAQHSQTEPASHAAATPLSCRSADEGGCLPDSMLCNTSVSVVCATAWLTTNASNTTQATLLVISMDS